MPFLGIDIGTSAVKAVLVDGEQRLLAEAEASLAISRPDPLWSEQEPDAWWLAAREVLARLRAGAPAAFGATQAIGQQAAGKGLQKQPHLSGPDDAGRAFARDRKENGPRDVEFILPVGSDEKRHGTMRQRLLWNHGIVLPVEDIRPTFRGGQIGAKIRWRHHFFPDAADSGAQRTTEIRLPRRCRIKAQARGSGPINDTRRAIGHDNFEFSDVTQQRNDARQPERVVGIIQQACVVGLG